MKRRILAALFFGLLVLSGCGSEMTYEPVDINPEVDVCEVCNMSIVHENYATQLISKAGDVYNFDDIGCMIEFVHEDQAISEDDIGKQYVRDVETGEWVELEEAWHVYYKEIWTPMANGVISFKTKEAAEEYIEKIGKGKLYDYEKLLEHPWEFHE